MGDMEGDEIEVPGHKTGFFFFLPISFFIYYTLYNQDR